MNAPWVGGDDRLFNRFVEEASTQENVIETERMYLSLDNHLENLMHAELALAMRYHGHVFCMALGLPFVSIDYTGSKGKVYSLISRIKYEKWSVKWDKLEGNASFHLIEELLTLREQMSNLLNQEAERLVQLLNKTYRDV